MKKILRSVIIITVITLVLGTNVLAITAVPASQSYNGYLPDGTSIFDDAEIQQHNEPTIIEPKAFIGYRYEPGYERLVDRSFVHQYAYIYGTSVDFVEGTLPEYKLDVTRSISKDTLWDISGNLSGEFNLSKVKAKLALSGGYSETNTATITVGETWKCGLITPGTYELAWYMRGHKFYAQCGATIVSTGADHGNFTYYNLGPVIFPSNEVHFSVTRVY